MPYTIGPCQPTTLRDHVHATNYSSETIKIRRRRHGLTITGKRADTLASIMRTLNHLFENNKAWAGRIREEEPDFFRNLSGQQSPSYLWIGCADSRVPANEIVGLLPGELFVHRNVANLVVHTDLNCLSVMQFAVDLLKVGHIIVCGHYGCSGVGAALRRDRLGLSDNWLRHVQDVRQKHERALANAGDDSQAASDSANSM